MSRGNGVPPLEARGITKVFTGGDGRALPILGGIDFQLSANETVAIIGASGAGKSTLLHVLGALDRPTAGEVIIEGRAVGTLGDEAIATIRNRSVGFV
ncbi:MAG: ATP-binding cassette domain-containing protein, partial [Gemmatimonadota bacterium]|nr:ATP-binding cassette domain-containing protein [Gemmatimonadota bacterium]